MRVFLDRSSAARLDLALDILRGAGISPSDRVQIGEEVALLVSDEVGRDAVEVLRRFGFTPRPDGHISSRDPAAKHLEAVILESRSAARLIGRCDTCNSPAPIAALVIFKGQTDRVDALCRDCLGTLEKQGIFEVV